MDQGVKGSLIHMIKDHKMSVYDLDIKLSETVDQNKRGVYWSGTITYAAHGAGFNLSYIIMKEKVS